jgi:hypothetical protein
VAKIISKNFDYKKNFDLLKKLVEVKSINKKGKVGKNIICRGEGIIVGVEEKFSSLRLDWIFLNIEIFL